MYLVEILVPSQEPRRDPVDPSCIRQTGPGGNASLALRLYATQTLIRA